MMFAIGTLSSSVYFQKELFLFKNLHLKLIVYWIAELQHASWRNNLIYA